MRGGCVLGGDGLQQTDSAKSAIHLDFRTLGDMTFHAARFDFLLAMLARHFYFGNDFACDSGGLVCDLFAPAAGTVAEFLDCLVDALEA